MRATLKSPKTGLLTTKPKSQTTTFFGLADFFAYCSRNGVNKGWPDWQKSKTRGKQGENQESNLE